MKCPSVKILFSSSVSHSLKQEILTLHLNTAVENQQEGHISILLHYMLKNKQI